MLTLLLLLFVVALLFGGYGTTRPGWGYYGWSPAGILLVIIILVLVMGRL
jgi:hypothetical protein